MVDNMKVLLINQHQFLQPEDKRRLEQVFTPAMLAQKRQQLTDFFHAAGLGVVCADELLTPEDFAAVGFNRTKAGQRYRSGITDAYADKATYFLALYRKLADTAGCLWTAEGIKQKIKVKLPATKDPNSDSVVGNFVSTLVGASRDDNSGAPVSRAQFFAQQAQAAQAKAAETTAVKTKAVEEAQAHAALAQSADNSAAPVESTTAATEATLASTEPASTELKLNEFGYEDFGEDEPVQAKPFVVKSAAEKGNLIIEDGVGYFDGDDDELVLDLRTRRDEWVLVLDELALLHPQFLAKLQTLMGMRISPDVLNLSHPTLGNALLSLGEDLPNLYEAAHKFAGILPPGQDLVLGEVAGHNPADYLASFWSPNISFAHEYKRGLHRYNAKLDSYCFVCSQDDHFATSAFLIRVSAIKAIAQAGFNDRVANDHFNLPTKALDVAYVRGVWAVAPSLAVIPRVEVEGSKFSDWWLKQAKRVNTYMRQLKLTASLDSQ